MTWDEAAGEWQIDIDGPDGDRTIRSRAVITSVGFLSRPNIPEIAGAEDVRRRLVAHGALAAGRRPEGQAGRGDRHRLHRLPDDPRARARGRPRHRVPADAAVAVPGARLPVAVPAAGQLARPQPAVPHQLHARPHLLARPASPTSREIDPDFRRSLRRQPAQQAGARRLRRLPGAQARRSGAGGGDDAAAPGLVGAARLSSIRNTASSTRCSATTSRWSPSGIERIDAARHRGQGRRRSTRST